MSKFYYWVCNARKSKIWKIVPAAIRDVPEKECAVNASRIIGKKGKFPPVSSQLNRKRNI